MTIERSKERSLLAFIFIEKYSPRTREKQIVTRAIGNRKENLGWQAFFRDN